MRLLLFILLLPFSKCFTQQVIVMNEKQNIVYCGVQNPLTAIVNGFSCEAITLRTTNGKIEKVGCGRFTYTPAFVSSAQIEVWVTQNEKIVKKEEWRFDVRYLPSPIAVMTVFAPEEGRNRPTQRDTIYKQWLSPFSGIHAVLPNQDYEAVFQIVTYTISAVRQSKVLFCQTNSGSRFEVHMIPYFDSLQAGDHLIFSNIVCTGPSLCNRQNPEPIRFYVAK